MTFPKNHDIIAKHLCASVAQSVVHLTRNEKVACSSQVTSSKNRDNPKGYPDFWINRGYNSNHINSTVQCPVCASGLTADFCLKRKCNKSGYNVKRVQFRTALLILYLLQFHTNNESVFLKIIGLVTVAGSTENMSRFSVFRAGMALPTL